jgi:hypothetical protein
MALPPTWHRFSFAQCQVWRCAPQRKIDLDQEFQAQAFSDFVPISAWCQIWQLLDR